MAARVAGQAAGGEILVSEPVATAIGDLDDIVLFDRALSGAEVVALAIDARGGAPEQLLSQEQARRYAEAVATLRERERALLRSRLEAGDKPPPFEELAGELGYPSAGAARQAFYKSKAQLLVRLAPDVHP